jgi:hypothetical protein
MEDAPSTPLPTGPERWSHPPAIEAVLEAAWRRNWRVVRAALADGFPVHATRPGSTSQVLHLAALSGHVPTIRAALALGAHPNDLASSTTAVGFAAQSGTAKALRVLLDAGGDPSLANDDGYSPLVAVTYARHGEDALDRLRVLLARPEVDLEVRFREKTAQEWASGAGALDLADAIAAEVGGWL